MSTIFFKDEVDFIYDKNTLKFLPTGEIDEENTEYVPRQRTLALHFRDGKYVISSTIRNPKEMDNRKLAKKVLMGRIEKYFSGKNTKFLVSFNSLEEIHNTFLTDSGEIPIEIVHYTLGGKINLEDLDYMLNLLEEKVEEKSWCEFTNS